MQNLKARLFMAALFISCVQMTSSSTLFGGGGYDASVDQIEVTPLVNDNPPQVDCTQSGPIILDVAVTVSNQGDQPGASLVELYDADSGTLMDSSFSFSLNPGESLVVDLQWLVPPGTDGLVNMEASLVHIADIDVDLSNDQLQSSFECIDFQPPIFVANIAMDTEKRAGRVRAEATVSIHDENNNPYEGALVLGSWTGATQSDVAGTTGPDGKVKLLSDFVRRGGSYQFCVTNVFKRNGDDHVYDDSLNVETCDQITELLPPVFQE